jgi:peptidoglycan/xylan/chitin deacetylase (PgdA/CDA1 family)
MPARFILSFDCEGKWGVADALSARHRRALTDERLGHAYRSILSILDEYGIPATFAFVGAFAQSAEGFARIRPRMEALAERAPHYLAPALRDVDEGGGDGWHGGAFVEAVISAQVAHEIALHGVTHVPWTSVDAEFVEAEMQLFHHLEGPIRDSRTFVFPRNLVAHANLLARHGFAGYRTARPERSRLASFLSEFNLFEAPEHPLWADRITRIPAGFFLNWRSGLRKLVPPAITRLRAKRLLERAGAADAVVHYWLHPENVATAPSTIGLVRMLAREVASARDTGHCEVMTQLGYCEWAESLR